MTTEKEQEIELKLNDLSNKFQCHSEIVQLELKVIEEKIDKLLGEDETQDKKIDSLEKNQAKYKYFALGALVIMISISSGIDKVLLRLLHF